jgi:hypothetical protein
MENSIKNNKIELDFLNKEFFKSINNNTIMVIIKSILKNKK